MKALWHICSHFILLAVYIFKPTMHISHDGVVSVVTCYKLNGLGFEPWWGKDFPYPSRSTPWPTQTPIQWVIGLFPGGKVSRALTTHQLQWNILLQITPLSCPIPTACQLCILHRNINEWQHSASKVTSINRHDINVSLLGCASVLLGR